MGGNDVENDLGIPFIDRDDRSGSREGDLITRESVGEQAEIKMVAVKRVICRFNYEFYL